MRLDSAAEPSANAWSRTLLQAERVLVLLSSKTEPIIGASGRVAWERRGVRAACLQPITALNVRGCSKLCSLLSDYGDLERKAFHLHHSTVRFCGRAASERQ